jgi:hypothetical protein
MADFKWALTFGHSSISVQSANNASTYLSDNAGVSGGGLFPKGMNGTLRTT